MPIFLILGHQLGPQKGQLLSGDIFPLLHRTVVLKHRQTDRHIKRAQLAYYIDTNSTNTVTDFS